MLKDGLGYAENKGGGLGGYDDYFLWIKYQDLQLVYLINEGFDFGFLILGWVFIWELFYGVFCAEAIGGAMVRILGGKLG